MELSVRRQAEEGPGATRGRFGGTSCGGRLRAERRRVDGATAGTQVRGPRGQRTGVRAMSSTRDKAATAREGHRRICGARFLRQAPSLRAGGGTKAAIIAWCSRKAVECGSTAWRCLGRAILRPALGASLIVSVGADVSVEAAALVADWLRWHRQRKRFGVADVRASKKASRLRALWNTIRRGSGVHSVAGGSSAQRVVEALSPRASVHLCDLRLEGAIRCRVGRVPLHMKGELPRATTLTGDVAVREWVSPQQATLTELEVYGALVDYAQGHLERRGFAALPGLQVLAPALRLYGGTKVMTAPKLTAAIRAARAGAGKRAVSLSSITANTLVASRLMTVLLVRLDEGRVTAEVLTAQDWATLMGVPLRWDHPLRTGLRAVSASAAKGIVGQAVQVDVARCVLRAACAHTEWWNTDRIVTYASLMSGLDFTAAAMEQVFGERFRFVLAAEANSTVMRALRAAWGHRLLHVTSNALSAETARHLRSIKEGLDILMISFRCAPWSTANTLPVSGLRRQEQLERALEENQELLKLARWSWPKLILIECVAGLLQRQLRTQWARLQGMILALKDWSWSRQTICPRDTLGGYLPRRRVWIIGVRLH